MDIEYLINEFHTVYSENKNSSEEQKKLLFSLSSELINKYKALYTSPKSLKLLDNLSELDRTHIEEMQIYQQIYFALYGFIGELIISYDPQNGGKLLKEIEKYMNPNIKRITALENMFSIYIRAIVAELPNIS